MRILVIGGTGFLGRHIVQSLAPNNFVTIFSRGSDRDYKLVPNIERITGDRHNKDDIQLLQQEDRWDCIIDLALNYQDEVNLTGEDPDADYATIIECLAEDLVGVA